MANVISPSSVKIPVDLKPEIDDWLYIHRKNFSPFVVELLKKHLKKNPLTPSEKRMAVKHKKSKI